MERKRTFGYQLEMRGKACLVGGEIQRNLEGREATEYMGEEEKSLMKGGMYVFELWEGKRNGLGYSGLNGDRRRCRRYENRVKGRI